jgi:hypothetical protein
MGAGFATAALLTTGSVGAQTKCSRISFITPQIAQYVALQPLYRRSCVVGFHSRASFCASANCAEVQAYLDFMTWRANHGYGSFIKFWQRASEWHETTEPYARSYQRIASAFPDQMRRFEVIVKPIQDTMLGPL